MPRAASARSGGTSRGTKKRTGQTSRRRAGASSRASAAVSKEAQAEAPAKPGVDLQEFDSFLIDLKDKLGYNYSTRSFAKFDFAEAAALKGTIDELRKELAEIKDKTAGIKSVKTNCPTNRILTENEAAACVGVTQMSDWSVASGYDGNFANVAKGTLEPGTYMLVSSYPKNQYGGNLSAEAVILDKKAGFKSQHSNGIFWTSIDLNHEIFQQESLRGRSYNSQLFNSNVPGVDAAALPKTLGLWIYKLKQ
ncbi:MAG: hypothetical protein LBT92_01860 [Rickettsiales bacterium]|nr:hypothetical protein [Rickettsiales bacterium]